MSNAREADLTFGKYFLNFLKIKIKCRVISPIFRHHHSSHHHRRTPDHKCCGVCLHHEAQEEVCFYNTGCDWLVCGRISEATVFVCVVEFFKVTVLFLRHLFDGLLIFFKLYPRFNVWSCLFILFDSFLYLFINQKENRLRTFCTTTFNLRITFPPFAESLLLIAIQKIF